MSYGRLNSPQKLLLQKYVLGQTVYDLGAGDGELSLELLNLGADKVFAIEKENIPGFDAPDIVVMNLRFEQLLEQVDQIAVSFISWPSNRSNRALLELIRLSEIVVYLGSNVNGSACADPSFFSMLLWRQILEYSPDQKNTLIVYGSKPREKPVIYGEEYAGLTLYQQDRPLSFEEVEDRFPEDFRI